MIEWSIDAFRACESVRAIVVAVPPGHEPRPRPAIGRSRVVEGGATRAQSVANALAAVETELVAIHDAARPLLTPGAGRRARRRARRRPRGRRRDRRHSRHRHGQAGGRTAICRSQDDEKSQLAVERTLDRSRLWAAQTPQVFRTEALRAALEVDAETRDAATDEAMLVEAAGGRC